MQTRSTAGNFGAPTPEIMQAKFDLAITLILHSWVSLSIAVQNMWGGPDAADRRDWFAGAISDLIRSEPEADVDYLEDFLVGVMNDNFDVHVDDDSAGDIAEQILSMRKTIAKGDFSEVDRSFAQWNERQKSGHGTKYLVQRGHADDSESETGDDTASDDEADIDDGGVDIEMDEAPQLVQTRREKVVASIDEDGFTKVVGKRRR